MIETIERMLTDLERGKLTRRQFAVSIATLAAGSLAAQGALAAPPAPAGFRAVSVNHITVKVPDLHRTSKFYQEFFGMPLRQQSATTHILGVGKSFFGIEQGDNQSASVNHYDFGIENFNADAIRGRLRELNLKFSGTSQESFKFNDPDGFLVQVNGPDYVGACVNQLRTCLPAVIASLMADRRMSSSPERSSVPCGRSKCWRNVGEFTATWTATLCNPSKWERPYEEDI